MAYGGAGAVISSSIILAFVWAPFAGVGPVRIVELESVMPGALAVTIMTDTPDINVTELKLTIDRLEVGLQDGGWSEIEIPGGRVSFDLFRLQGTFIGDVISQLELESVVRMHMVRGFEYVNATLSNGDVVDVVLPSEYIEVTVPTAIGVRVYIVGT